MCKEEVTRKVGKFSLASILRVSKTGRIWCGIVSFVVYKVCALLGGKRNLHLFTICLQMIGFRANKASFKCKVWPPEVQIYTNKFSKSRAVTLIKMVRSDNMFKTFQNAEISDVKKNLQKASGMLWWRKVSYILSSESL